MDDTILGYDENGDPIYADSQMLGAMRPFGLQRMLAQRGPGPGRRFLVPPAGRGLPARHPMTMPFPGAAGPAGGSTTIAFPVVQFTNVSLLNFVVVSNPNRLLRPSKLVAVVNRSAGAVVEIPYVANLTVGPINQFSDANPKPAEAFTSDNTFSLNGTPATQGTVISANITCSANPGAGETIDVILMLACDAVM
jgi:hypothetical protein